MSDKLDERKEVLEILSNPFKPGDMATVCVTMQVEVVKYWRDGFYQVKFPDGMWDGDVVLYHFKDMTAPKTPKV